MGFFISLLAAFGPNGNSIRPKQYERLCRRARWLDENGHLLIEAMYAPDEAELEDLDYYADYLLKEHRDGLLAFCFSEELSDEELREGLLRSFDAVREVALLTRELCSWREKYFFPAADYRALLSDDGPLGRDDLQTIYRGLTRVPTGELCCYSPIGPRILDLLKQDGLTMEEEALVRGCAYVQAICHANTYVAEALEREQRDGVLPEGIHLRLDDDWQAGGIWRAERVNCPERYSLSSVPALLPLGLGYLESQPEPAIVETFTPAEQPLCATQTSFRVALTLRDRALRRLRLTREAAGALATGAVDVSLVHGGTRERCPVEREGTVLYGVPWPWDCHPGLILTCNVERSGSVVKIRSVPITPPIVASDGRSFDYETSLAVYDRERGLKELPTSEKRNAPTLAELVNRTFRLRGRKRADGSHALTPSELATVILGPGWGAGATRPLQEALAAMGLERDDADLIWRPRVTAHTRASERSLLAAYGQAKAGGRLARAARRHWVPMHLRRYTERSGRTPSAVKRATYADARRRFGMHGVLPEELPEGCTWVKPYDSGGDDGEEPTGTQLEIESDTVDAEAPSDGAEHASLDVRISS